MTVDELAQHVRELAQLTQQMNGALRDLTQAMVDELHQRDQHIRDLEVALSEHMADDARHAVIR